VAVRFVLSFPAAEQQRIDGAEAQYLYALRPIEELDLG